MTNDTTGISYICPGCTVCEPWEHRCYRDESDGYNNPERKMCACSDCRSVPPMFKPVAELTANDIDEIVEFYRDRLYVDGVNHIALRMKCLDEYEAAIGRAQGVPS